ncbi:MAG: N-acetylmuramoyl-L-alanine amidase [Candidatus Gracilibacteria bacterium]
MSDFSKEVINSVLPIDAFKDTFNNLGKEVTDGLKKNLTDTVKTGLKELNTSIIAPAVMPKMLSLVKSFESLIGGFKKKNENNPVFDFLLSPVEDGIQIAQDEATANLLGKDSKDTTLKLEDVAAAQFPNEDMKVAIFKKLTGNEVDPKNMPLNTGVKIRQSYIEKLLKKDTPFMKEYLNTTSVAHFIPDTSITKIKVLHPKTSMFAKVESEIYTREEKDGKIEFVSNGRVLKLNEMTAFKVEEKGERKNLEIQFDETKRIVSNEYSGGANLDSDRGRFVYKTYKTIDTKTLGQPQEVACHATASKIMEKISGEKIDMGKKPIFVNKQATPDMLARTSIPNKIKELNLQPGTAFWIKLQPGTNDPTSQLSASGNHWFTYIGNNPTSGEPQFVDQYGVQTALGMEYTNSAKYKNGRYLHAIFTPNEATLQAKLNQYVASNPLKKVDPNNVKEILSDHTAFEREVLHDASGTIRPWKEIQDMIMKNPQWKTYYMDWHAKQNAEAAKKTKQLFSDLPAGALESTQQGVEKYGVNVFSTKTYKEGEKTPYANFGNTKYGENIFKKPIGIVTHFTAGNSVGSALNTWNGTGDKHTSVHYIIDKKGDILQLGPDNRIVKGAAGDYPPRFYNAAFIQIEVVANQYSDINKKQMNALLALEAAKAKQYNIPTNNIVGHGEIEEHDHESHGGAMDRTDFTSSQIAKLRQDITPYLA